MSSIARKKRFCSVLIIWAFANAAYADCEEIFRPSTPTEDFSVHGDGTVTHARTQLMWKVCPEGAGWVSGSTCSGEPSIYSWQGSLQQVAVVNTSGGYAGYTDWRLPNIKELMSIIEDQCSEPALNETVLNAGDLVSVYGYFWSSTPSMRIGGYGAEYSYRVDVRAGSSSHIPRDTSAQIRLVRDVK